MYRAVVTALICMFSVSAIAANRVAKFDKDKDLHVNYVELTSQCQVSQQLFELADKNADGVLSEFEMRTAKGYLFSKCKKENKDL